MQLVACRSRSPGSDSSGDEAEPIRGIPIGAHLPFARGFPHLKSASSSPLDLLAPWPHLYFLLASAGTLSLLYDSEKSSRFTAKNLDKVCFIYLDSRRTQRKTVRFRNEPSAAGGWELSYNTSVTTTSVSRSSSVSRSGFDSTGAALRLLGSWHPQFLSEVEGSASCPGIFLLRNPQ